ncbi:MAG: type IV secretion system protein [Rickettsiaceae bacterium]|nr:type IV secretion system protein [Rickettsiaceae bacterium]
MILLLSSKLVYAQYGESCVPVNFPETDNYLTEGTAYGYIKNNIDMKTYVSNACDIEGKDLKFCIRNENPVPDPCTEVTLSLDNSATLGSLSSNPDIGGNDLLKDIELKVELIDSSICLTMPTSRGHAPIICRAASDEVIEESLEEVCRIIADSCYEGNKSQSMVNFSGRAIQCLTESLDKVFYQYNTDCLPENTPEITILSPFPTFQEALKVAIRAALVLYAMVYGFKLVMNMEYASLNQISIFVAKIILVAYFAVGLGPLYFVQGKQTQHNGMTEVALPILTQLTSDFAEIVFSAAGSQGLCEFDRDKYEVGYEYYKMWDAIDCRIGYYLGMQLLYNIGSLLDDATSSGSSGGTGNSVDLGDPSTVDAAVDVLATPANLSFFSVMFGFFIAGNIIIVLAGIVFALFFISVILYFLTAYLVCLITLYVMAYISPIFITMALFERTKSYFDAWLRVTLSCTLQPAIIGGFIALLLTMYDSAIYGNCEFKRHDYSIADISFSTFELQSPDADSEECLESPGYKLMKYYTGSGWQSVHVILFDIKFIKDVLKLNTNLFYVLVFTFIFYYFMQSVNEFAADITSGARLSAVTASPTAFVDGAMKMASYARDSQQAMKDMAKNVAEGDKGKDGGDTKRGGIDKDSGGGGSGSSGGGDMISKAGGGGS